MDLKQNIKPKNNDQSNNKTKENDLQFLLSNRKYSSTVLYSTIIVTLLIICAYMISENGRPVTYLVCLTGCIFGWVAGIITSPFDNKDKERMINISKLVGTFLSGYIFSKIDGFLKNISVDNINDPHNYLLELRLILFTCFFALAWIVVFVFRNYGTIPEGVPSTDPTNETEEHPA